LVFFPMADGLGYAASMERKRTEYDVADQEAG
jgi:hypothetical protein